MGLWMFDPHGSYVPCVGVIIGIERLFSIMESSADTNQRHGDILRGLEEGDCGSDGEAG